MTLTNLEYERLSTCNLMQLIESKREFLKQAVDNNEKIIIANEIKEVEKLLNLSQLFDELRDRHIRFSVENEGKSILVYAKENIRYFPEQKKIEFLRMGKAENCEDLFAVLDRI